MRSALLLALLFGVLVASLISLDGSGAWRLLAPDWSYELPLIALVIGAFLVGASLALLLGAIRDLTRSVRTHRHAREARREESLNETYHRGVDAQLAGKPDAAVHMFTDLLRR